MKHFYLGYSYVISNENGRFSFIVRNYMDGICDSGYSTSHGGADKKARRIIKMFSSK
ncbi:MAG: hypothetical protein WCW84_07940 [Sulfurimonas sp.]